jgi:hypothetical protein
VSSADAGRTSEVVVTEEARLLSMRRFVATVCEFTSGWAVADMALAGWERRREGLGVMRIQLVILN